MSDRASWWSPSNPGEEAIEETLRSRGVDFMAWPGWLNVDGEEKRLGQLSGRERLKLHNRAEMLDISKGR
jgi:ferredoxin--NADP+ reductase